MPGIWELSKKDANYRPAPKPQVRCDACAFMFPKFAVGSCKFVRGVIVATYTCDEFQPATRREGG